MRLCFFYFVFLSAVTMADPFYAKENTQDQPQTAKDQNKTTACTPTEKVNEIHLTTDFDKLQLIGIIQIDDKIRAIFIDDKKQLIDLYPDDYLSHSFIQIKEINFKSVSYIDWQKTENCQSPKFFTSKF
ncbi:pilus assembly protein PilP [Glaesserella parasuis]|uniref:pilus assembly protein PilP n=2 Tax=Glaesserella parasuis TaxID=738 RepID=UPI00135D9FF5|nr:pilus assembly protein PilP [Glaesserella parasuis]MDG6237165.1 pilus assembly protein PilP [Glaesserella parasuis]MDP0232487.1 pilus assembly protein PilP [Glaesserella parasuis]MDP0322170.1 pilus assembly protein PilP [Glaesserella parasuis]MWQ07355.1 hypothetical protein [Glaesserella parasuis]MWQ28686.1 hypothetical protein [Glaesserella parasuis]